MKIFLIILSGIFLMHFKDCLDFKLEHVPEIEKLPSVTESGENTFACLINGDAFVPIPEFETRAEYYSGKMTISGDIHPHMMRTDKIKEWSITLIINKSEDQIKESWYSFNNYPDLYATAYIDETGCDYKGDSIKSGNVTITRFDKINHIIAGTFEFSIISGGCEKLDITNGLFDMVYQKYQ